MFDPIVCDIHNCEVLAKNMLVVFNADKSRTWLLCGLCCESKLSGVRTDFAAGAVTKFEIAGLDSNELPAIKSYPSGLMKHHATQGNEEDMMAVTGRNERGGVTTGMVGAMLALFTVSSAIAVVFRIFVNQQVDRPLLGVTEWVLLVFAVAGVLGVLWCSWIVLGDHRRYVKRTQELKSA